MYKEMRLQGSTPEGWARNFLEGRSSLPTMTEASLRNDPRWREIRQRLAPGASVIDAGCGLGAWVRFLRERGFDAEGVDYSEEMCGRLRREVPEITWSVADVRKLPHADSSRDAIVSWGVIEHEEEGPDAAMREFFRVVRPGGWIFVTVPYDTFEHRYASMIQVDDPSPNGTFFQYMLKPSEFSDLATRTGFEVALVTPCSRHPAVLMPKTFRALNRAPRVVYRVGFKLLWTAAQAMSAADNMLLLVARKP